MNTIITLIYAFDFTAIGIKLITNGNTFSIVEDIDPDMKPYINPDVLTLINGYADKTYNDFRTACEDFHELSDLLHVERIEYTAKGDEYLESIEA